MTLSDAVKTCFAKYTTFQGRAPRSEYWYFVLFGLLCEIGLFIAFGIARTILGDTVGVIVMIAGILGVMALILPHISVMVRRLHDTGRSGWWYWIALIPFGSIVLLVWFCSRGTVGSNQYGSDPLGGDLEQTFG